MSWLLVMNNVLVSLAWAESATMIPNTIILIVRIINSQCIGLSQDRVTAANELALTDMYPAKIKARIQNIAL